MGKKKYKLPRKHLIPLSREFTEHSVFKKASAVLAMYPDTTTFYPATVTGLPTASNNYTYQIKFEDDQDDSGKTPSRKVSYRFVTKLPEKNETETESDSASSSNVANKTKAGKQTK